MSVPKLSDPLIGSVIGSRYEIVRKIARGGMATVYYARDRRLRRMVAVKVMHDTLGDDQDFLKKFDREARASAKLSHPNVVAVFDQGIDGDRPYIVMEYVAGPTLRQIIISEGALPPRRALAIMEQVLAGLAAAHAQGVIHRDIKPENVLIAKDDHVKVTDFGLAKEITSQSMTATAGLLMGTVSYIPPELVRAGSATPRADVYSAGVVLFEMLTGSKPFSGETPIQVAYAHVHEAVPAPSTWTNTSWTSTRDAIPPYVDALVQCATQRELDLRPLNARVFMQSLREAKTALNRNIMNDPRLDTLMTTVEYDDDAPMLRPKLPRRRIFASSDSIHAQLPPLPASTPVSPVDVENSLPDLHAEVDVEETPVEPLPEPIVTFERKPTRRPAPQRVPRNRLVEAEPETPDSVAEIQLTADKDAEDSIEYEPAPSRFGFALPHVQRPNLRHVPALVGQQWRPLMALVVLVAIVLSVSYGAWYLLAGRYTSVPTLTAMTRVDAEKAAQGANVELFMAEEYSETTPVGQIVRTDPQSGAKVVKDTKVSVFVSKGAERYAVPELVGLSQKDAEAAITRANLTVGPVSQDFSDSVPAGIVLSASQQPGSQLKKAEPVNLAVSKGPQPLVVVNCAGKPFDACAGQFTTAGFKVEKTEQHDKTVPAGAVISQSPAEGQGKKGDVITMVVSLGPVSIEVPDVRQKDQAAAEAELKKAGFQVKVEKMPNPVPFNVVSDSKPAHGEKAAEGSTVTIVVL